MQSLLLQWCFLVVSGITDPANCSRMIYVMLDEIVFRVSHAQLSRKAHKPMLSGDKSPISLLKRAFAASRTHTRRQLLLCTFQRHRW
ncbi:hypothetical protein BJY04DRAFT_63761 [Aspergillus karnatakaensis]|uniref:uncharacterized protein n=1 Tax=Aspergillus karnatakaensis TaxID=1810916 RepID=UPI003CCDDB58